MRFNPSHIKYLIHTYVNFAHFGGSSEFRALYGYKTIMSRIDFEMIGDNPNGVLIDMNSNSYAELPIIDEVFGDGDVIVLGDICIRCIIAPGHTQGNTIFLQNR